MWRSLLPDCTRASFIWWRCKGLAIGAAKPKRGFTVFWMMVLAIAILDDGERREKDRQRQRRQVQKPAGPRP